MGCRLAAAALLLALAVAPARAGGVDPVSQLWALGPAVAAQRISLGDLRRAVVAADIVLAGERHDNRHHHAGQAAIVRAAAADGRKVVVVLEMLERGQQAALNRWRADGGGAAGFADAVGWRARGWPDAALYRPLFAAMFAVDADIVAGDLSKARIRRVGEQGLDAAPAGLATRFSLRAPLDPTVAATMRAIQYAAHCRLMPMAAMAPMVAVQRLRDAALAGAILDARDAQPHARVVLVAGGGHVRNDHGVGALLRAVAPDARVLTVGFAESETPIGRDAVAALRNEFDILWVTGPAGGPDPCAGLARQPAR